MTTVKLTYDSLVPVEYVNYTYKIISPVIQSNFRAYGNYAEFTYETTTGIIDNSPAYIYLAGPGGVTAYNVPDPLDRNYNSARYFVAVGHPVLGNFGTVNTADSIGLGNHADFVYAGPGNDSIYAVATTSTAAKYLVGGSGDDTIQSSYGADILYGDFADAPVFVTDTQWQTPASADPAVVDGKDYLDGNYGPDTLYGGGGDDVLIGDPDVDSSYDDQDELHGGDGNDQLMGGTAADQLMGDDGDDVLMGQRGGDTLVGGDGNDMLNGGPRGSGWTDVLTGGAGSDAFMLSYTPASDSDTSDGQSFWQSWGADFVANAAGGGVFSGVTDLSTAAAKAFFESLTGSILLGGLSTAIGGAVTNALSFLFHQSKSSTPQPSGEDVMVVTDFDPRDDVLFLPLPTVDQNNPATTLTSTPTYYSESAAGSNGQTGWGIEFAKGTGNTIFAEVFLAQDFLDAFGVTEDSEFAADFIHDVFDTSLVIDENGVQDLQNVYPFPTDPSAYADGVVPTVADTPIPFAAPSGTTTKIFGAFGGLSFVAPTTTSTGVYVSGTNLSDILNVNPASFDPATATSSGNLTSQTSHVMGFAGDDIIFGGNGIDVVHGGDGDDWIYGIGHEGVETVETFAGDDGDDLIYLGWTSMSAIVDGGDGTDTASFAYVTGTVTADLSIVTTNPLKESNATSTTTADSLISTYALIDIENLGGSDNDDTLTGDGNDNVLDSAARATTSDRQCRRRLHDRRRWLRHRRLRRQWRHRRWMSTLRPRTRAAMPSAPGSTLSVFRMSSIGPRSRPDRGTPAADYMLGDGGNGTNPLFAADFYGMGGDDLAGSGLGQTLDGGDGTTSSRVSAVPIRWSAATATTSSPASRRTSPATSSWTSRWTTCCASSTLAPFRPLLRRARRGGEHDEPNNPRHHRGGRHDRAGQGHAPGGSRRPLRDHDRQRLHRHHLHVRPTDLRHRRRRRACRHGRPRYHPSLRRRRHGVWSRWRRQDLRRRRQRQAARRPGRRPDPRRQRQ